MPRSTAAHKTKEGGVAASSAQDEDEPPTRARATWRIIALAPLVARGENTQRAFACFEPRAAVSSPRLGADMDLAGAGRTARDPVAAKAPLRDREIIHIHVGIVVKVHSLALWPKQNRGA